MVELNTLEQKILKLKLQKEKDKNNLIIINENIKVPLDKLIPHKIKVFNARLFNRSIDQEERELLLKFFAKGIERGISLNLLIKVKSEEYTLSGKIEYLKLMNNLLKKVNDDGENITKSMYELNIINDYEFSILDSSPRMDDALEYILGSNSNNRQMNKIILSLFLPPLLGSLILIIGQPYLYELGHSIVDPINNLAKESNIQIPVYLNDKITFIKMFIIFLLTTIGFLSFMKIIKRYYIKQYFQLFPFTEKETTLEIMTNIYNLHKTGFSIGQSIDMLSKQNTKSFNNKIFSEMNDVLKTGNMNLHLILNKYGFDPFTVGLFKIAETTSDFKEMLEDIITYNNERYNIMLKRLKTFVPLIGQLLMTAVILKPILDLIMLSTVGIMNGFKI